MPHTIPRSCIAKSVCISKDSGYATYHIRIMHWKKGMDPVNVPKSEGFESVCIP